MQNLIIDFPATYYENKLQKMTAACVSFLFPAGQSFYFSNWFKTLFAVLEETKMKALK